MELEVFDTIDGQGKPSYLTPVEVEGRVLRQDKFIVVGDGSKLKTELTIWVPGTETTLPSEKDRITYDSKTFIVAVIKEVKRGDATVVHRRVRCRRE